MCDCINTNGRTIISSAVQEKQVVQINYHEKYVVYILNVQLIINMSIN